MDDNKKQQPNRLQHNAEAKSHRKVFAIGREYGQKANRASSTDASNLDLKVKRVDPKKDDANLGRRRPRPQDSNKENLSNRPSVRKPQVKLNQHKTKVTDNLTGDEKADSLLVRRRMLQDETYRAYDRLLRPDSNKIAKRQGIATSQDKHQQLPEIKRVKLQPAKLVHEEDTANNLLTTKEDTYLSETPVDLETTTPDKRLTPIFSLELDSENSAHETDPENISALPFKLLQPLKVNSPEWTEVYGDNTLADFGDETRYPACDFPAKGYTLNMIEVPSVEDNDFDPYYPDDETAEIEYAESKDSQSFAQWLLVFLLVVNLILGIGGVYGLNFLNLLQGSEQSNLIFYTASSTLLLLVLSFIPNRFKLLKRISAFIALLVFISLIAWLGIKAMGYSLDLPFDISYYLPF